jgi:hypothetical protein
MLLLPLLLRSAAAAAAARPQLAHDLAREVVDVHHARRAGLGHLRQQLLELLGAEAAQRRRRRLRAAAAVGVQEGVVQQLLAVGWWVGWLGGWWRLVVTFPQQCRRSANSPVFAPRPNPTSPPAPPAS